jgi:hypothetical protein
MQGKSNEKGKEIRASTYVVSIPIMIKCRDLTSIVLLLFIKR